MQRPRFGDGYPVLGRLHSGLQSLGSGLQCGRAAIADAITRDEIPVPEADEFHDIPEEGRTPADGVPVVAPPFFTPTFRQDLASTLQDLAPGALGAAAVAAAGATSFTPVFGGFAAGTALRQAYQGRFSSVGAAHTEPHTAAMADPRASMRQRIESTPAQRDTPQMTQEESDIYIEVLEERLANGASEEDAHRFAWDAVERFREEQEIRERSRFRATDAERELERELDRERREEYRADRRARRSSGSSGGGARASHSASSGGILAVRPGPSSASRAERIVTGQRELSAAPGDMVAAANAMVAASRRRGGRP